MSDGSIASPANRVLRVGSHKVEGRAAGTYVNVVQPEQITLNIGVDSEGMFVDNGNQSAEITVALLPSSASNDVFDSLMVSKLPVPILLTEIDSRTVGGCARGMCVKKADITWSDGSDVRLWTFRTTHWTSRVGGSDPAPLNSEI
jgi:hypothetical protein